LRQFPFARYAAWYNFAYAEVAQSCDIDQREFLVNFEPPDRTLIQKWVMLHNDLHYSDYPTDTTAIFDSNDSLVYLLSYQNLPNLLLILIENNGNINAVGKQHGSPLQLAAHKGYTTIAQHLIAAGADMELPRGGYEASVIFISLYTKQEDFALLLLENGARYDIVNYVSETPLIVAARSGCMAVVHKLLQLGANVNIEGGRALQAAANTRNWQIVQLLLHSGADVNFGDENNRLALESASIQGNYLMVKLLLESGAIVNNGSGRHKNPLWAAAFSGDVQIVQLLLQSGADVNRGGDCDYSDALQVAADHGHEKVVRLLLHAGANAKREGIGYYGSALQAAAHRCDENIVRMLLDAGADVNSMDGSGGEGSALQAAARNGSEDVVQLLLDAGADVNRMDGSDGSALQVAASKGNEKVVRLLLDAGADVNSMGGRSGSALQVAVKNGDEKIVMLLLDAGAVALRLYRLRSTSRPSDRGIQTSDPQI
jgi:ankyrin repeat protein